MPHVAIIDQAIPEESTWVVLTGNHAYVEIAIVPAATISAAAPCA